MIYLDANATSRLRPEAREAVLRILGADRAYRNPSSIHQGGRKARALLREARREILDLLSPGEKPRARLVFTSGGTEACNQIMFGFLGTVADGTRQRGHIVTSAIEHPAILEAAAVLERSGFSVTRVQPDTCGVVSPKDVVAAIRPDTCLVSLMGANNESGALQPVATCATALRESGYQGPIVSDMVQALGKSELCLAELFNTGVNAIAISGHKIGAPAGIGAVVFSEADHGVCFPLFPQLVGGPQEQRLRAGSENCIGIAAFGAAAAAVRANLQADIQHRRLLRELLWQEIATAIEQVERLGPVPIVPGSAAQENLVSNTLLLRFAGCRGDDLVVALDLLGLAASTGAACASGKQGVSEAVKALGLSAAGAKEVIRLSLDWDTSEDDIRRAVLLLQHAVREIRASAQNEPQHAVG